MIDDDHLESPEEMATQTGPGSDAPFATPNKHAKAKELIRAIAVGQNNATLYPDSHPLVAQGLQDIVEAVHALADMGFEEVTVNVYKGTLFLENQVFPEESVTHRKLIEDLLARGVSAITLEDSINPADARALVKLIVDTDISDIESARRSLELDGVASVSVSETTALDEDRSKAEDRESKTRSKEAYDLGIAVMQDVETQTKLGKAFEAGPLQGLVNTLLDNLFRDPAAVLGLTAIKGHDDYTLNHAINVCILSLSFGASIGLDSDSLRSLGLSALLYDLGKVRIPEDILAKEGPLTSDEWQIVKSHASEGADLLKRIQLVDQMPMVVAYEHHQRHDLQGYPEVESGTEQHLFSKVVALCDAYDAMTTRRPFRREIRPDKALAVLMQGRGKAYDPSLTKSFVQMLGIYPMGAIVRLSDGTTGVVYRVNRDDLLRPRVKVLSDASGRWYEEPPVVDLRLIDPTSGLPSCSIVEAVPSAEAGIDDVWQYL